MAKEQQLGLLGVALAAIGCFLPIMTVAFIGSVNYYFNGEGDGIIVLILSAGGLLFFLRGSYGLGLASGLLIAAMCTYTFFNLQGIIGNDPLASMLVRLDFGWLVLYSGAGLMIYAGYSGRKNAVDYVA